MNNKRNRRIALVVAVLMLTMAFSSTGFAAWTGKTLNAQFRNVSIFVNNQYKQATDSNGKVIEPFIVDGTTYVPLRGIAQMFGYEVGFNPQTYRIDITGDVAGNNAAAQYEILILEARIAELEDELEEMETSSMDLGDLEDQLIDDYDVIEDLDIEDIKLDGDEDDIEVEIYIDTTDNSQWSAWSDLNDADIEDFLQDIVDDILREYPEADITGFIWDEYDDGEKVETFGITSRGIVDLGAGSSASGDIGDLEDDLNDEFDRNYGVNFDISVEEEASDEIYITINTDSSDVTEEIYEDEMEEILEDMANVIDNYFDFSDYFVEGEIVDDVGSLDFEFDSSGNVDYLEWY